MSNQEVIDFCRVNITLTKGDLGLVAESLMDYCLAPDSDLGSIGCDNMTVVLVAIYRDGQSEEAWLDAMTSSVTESGLKVDPAKSVAARSAGTQRGVLGLASPPTSAVTASLSDSDEQDDSVDAV